MTDVYRIGAMTTDVITGRTPIVMAIGIATTANTTGYCCHTNGADYQVPANREFHVTGIISINGYYLDVLTLRYADNAALTTNPVDTGIAFPAAALPNMIIPVGGVAAIPTGHYVGVWCEVGSGSAGTFAVIGFEVVV